VLHVSSSVNRRAMRQFGTAVMSAGLLGALAVIPAHAGNPPSGVWIDHTGRGGVEFRTCGRGICGVIVWVRSKTDNHGCGRKLIGDVKPMGRNVWDGGWIISPESGTKYDVEVKVLSRSKIQIMGYAGSKFLSKTMTWTRAPSTIKRCDGAPVENSQIAAKSADKKVAARAAAQPLTSAPVPGRRPEAEAAAVRAKLLAARADEVVAPAPRALAPRRIEDLIAETESMEIATVVPPKPRLAKRDAPRRKYGLNRSARLGGTCTVRAPFVTVSFPCRKSK